MQFLAGEAIFLDNVKYNKAMSRRNTKPKNKNIRKGLPMKDRITPIKTLELVKELAFPSSRTTLLDYEKKGLVGEPQRGSHGQARGRFTHYSRNQVAEFYAAVAVKRVFRITLDEILKIKIFYEALAAAGEKYKYDPKDFTQQKMLAAAFYAEKRLEMLQHQRVDEKTIARLEHAKTIIGIEALKWLQPS